MDYSAHLSKTILNPNRNSRHYTKQSRFEGSMRQMRGLILKRVVEKIPFDDIVDDPRFDKALADLQSEGLI